MTAGNAYDRLGHAPHLLGFDIFVTTERRFSEILADVKAQMSDVALSRVVLVDSEATSALAAIKNAVA
ncbi:MAG TPA: hypothetical protein VJQ08_08700 [Candidatus Dormibacteraeota bacterium]|nr:hypothetical protein [Candidatus Dormibacteraeota bacterium]